MKLICLPDVLDHRPWISIRPHLEAGDAPQCVAALHNVPLGGSGDRRRLTRAVPGPGDDPDERRSESGQTAQSNPCSRHGPQYLEHGFARQVVEHMFAWPRFPCYRPLMEKMTPRQQRILDFIRRTVQERGYPPTVREIGEAVGLTSSSSVHAQIGNLQRKGLLRKDPAKPRAIEVAGGRPANAVVVPLVGRIAAGAPAMADENVEEFLTLPASFAGDQEHFALTVRGDSMVEAGILDGDIVVVRQQDSAKDGEIVAALLPGPAEDEATVKRLRRRGEQLMLSPENPTLEPFAFPEDARILGVVISVLRKL